MKFVRFSEMERVLGALCMLVAVYSLSGAERLLAQQPATPANPQKTIVIGFVGGVVKRNDPRRSEVHLAERLQADFPVAAVAQVFENRRRDEAHQFVLCQLGKQTDAPLSIAQKENARIVIYGHSWGAATVVALARQLKRDGIPVLLTIQVDSVHKLGQGDSVIPPNVREAVNFFQPDGILHGRKRIRAADPGRTTILGNFEMDYKQRHVTCKDYPWYELKFTKTHLEIECDPLVWNQIEGLIRAKITAGADAKGN